MNIAPTGIRISTTSTRARPSAWLATVVAGSLLAACANMSEEQKGTAKGAGIGAAVGGVAGVLIGDNKRGAATGAAIGAVGGAIAGNIWSRRMEEKKRALEQQTQGTGIDVAQTPNNELKVNVPADSGFATGRSEVRPQLRSVLDTFAAGLDPNMRVRVIGHTDSTGSDAINDPLSLDRAHSVRDYLAARGVQPARVETAGRGSKEPVADNSSESGRAANRRVEIFLREPEQAAASGAQPRS
ncbi:MAG TPA: OmpA family protein [Methylibium sp.]|uniref:OmpA family protein n=1 Tax=Methylibium sp. TaxID=2067992 RepID=UPI002DB802A8|nr:OmpA family protein [Methylibium sp.]HEU4460284.1 OmpA family protein [Methylibium sp.]